ncbi:hypothetical protein U0038_11320 [Sphingobacterium spiritivorum]|uniref:Uncharacterized protein n=1 Tax=Sphingobacterium spiritivorum ATCC 33861 TaxID=525373 RepID=D7VRX3_SPHSI|nr:hypothetical protein [Sphingobacterium spiritivorum]EFK56524.1 hypothetical protein HMPREF0766_13727 [Sphingobacterium spiritivorum ATCC 33861]QQT35412.1 hypothetical protein I6J01_19370 [Sphingobacterium spiritivorum]WQD32098.1 hypothetical protein U0038_11320 [Sphingobacterium spiritivorum]SUJ05812.1 Uncharacterised protein [Sphingobacterium spiritivorum]
MEEEFIHTEAKVALIQKLKQFSYVPLPEPVSTDRIKFSANNGDTYEVILCFLNLDKARSISINQRDFDYTPRVDLLVMLTIYMHDMNPVMYLIPSMVFATPNAIFQNHEQPDNLRHFSTWQIKIFTKAIEELSHYALDAVNEL